MKSLAIGDALIVSLIGMSIVFFGLVVLIFLIKALVAATSGIGKKKPAPSTVTAAPAAAAASAAEEVAAQNDSELIAVITAAIACMTEQGSSFTVKHVRRVNNTPAWQRLARQEQITSHF